MRMETPQSPAPRPVAAPAHAGWRLVALTYDALPIIPLLFIVSALFLWANRGHTIESRPLLQWLAFALDLLLVGAYFVLSWRRGGQTMGMRPWKLRVVDDAGNAPGARALWLRYFVALATLGLGLLWAFVDKERRAIYDRAAGTYFVRLGKSGSEQ